MLDALNTITNSMGIISPIPLLLFLILFLLTALSLVHTDVRIDETVRKAVHIFFSLVLFVSTFFCNQIELLLLGLALFAGMSLYVLDTPSGERSRVWGYILFPLGFITLVLLFSEHNSNALRFGILVLGISDALAALVGKRWGIQWLFGKSKIGSEVFFASTLFLSSFFFSSVFTMMCVSIILTFVELISKRGIDNLVLPITAGLLVVLL